MRASLGLCPRRRQRSNCKPLGSSWLIRLARSPEWMEQTIRSNIWRWSWLRNSALRSSSSARRNPSNLTCFRLSTRSSWILRRRSPLNRLWAIKMRTTFLTTNSLQWPITWCVAKRSSRTRYINDFQRNTRRRKKVNRLRNQKQLWRSSHESSSSMLETRKELSLNRAPVLGSSTINHRSKISRRGSS